MNKYICSKCGSSQINYIVKLLWNNQKQLITDPLTKLMIKVLCSNCDSYIKFAPLTKELIIFLTEQLSSVKIPLVPMVAPDENLPIFATKGGQSEK